MSDDLKEITWVEELPKILHGGGRKPMYPGLLAQLDEHPGQWALLREFPGKHVPATTRTRLKNRYPDYEFSVRGKKLYARRREEA